MYTVQLEQRNIPASTIISLPTFSLFSLLIFSSFCRYLFLRIVSLIFLIASISLSLRILLKGDNWFKKLHKMYNLAEFSEIYGKVLQKN